MSKEKPGHENGLVKLAMWLIGFTAAVGALFWAGAMIIGMITLFPYGLIGLIGLAALAIMVFVVIRDRINSKEDDYYSKNVDQ
jgi:apolipoprotein N-acyltransferase